MVGISLPDLNEPLPDDETGGAVGQLLHEVPGFDPAHPGAVGVVHSHDLVANVENLGLVRSSACLFQGNQLVLPLHFGEFF